MENGSIPLWAFLATGLVAVLGPLATTTLANWNATKLRSADTAWARRTWLDDHRVQTYRGALHAVSHAARHLSLERSGTEVPAQARLTVTQALHDAEAEVALFASADAKDSFHRVMVTWYETRAHTDPEGAHAGVARTNFDDAGRDFTRCVRADLLG